MRMKTSGLSRTLQGNYGSLRFKIVLFTGAMLIASLLFAGRASANSALCGSGLRCAPSPVDSTADPERQLLEFTAALQLSTASGTGAGLGRTELSDQESSSFSGVGAVVCAVNGKQRMATAFLVGAFDIGVTVGHTFADDGSWTAPENCVYTSTDSLGQIRERIPVSYIKAQWQAEAGAFGQPAKDFAVIRLSQPSRYAQRTMPLGKFSGAAASVLMIGFKSDMDVDAMKSKRRGMVYERKANGIAISNLAGFMHDMDSRGIAPGAPVIDERTGVIIGLHTTWKQSSPTARPLAARNTMITMNDWLESTLRQELQSVARAE
jgi:hypothetical protein